jgi:molybdenum cofactor biosynthesis enzyme MoaA
MKAIKFLVTNQCNLRCDFCHNEFQGDATKASANPNPYSDDNVVSLLTAHQSAHTLKLSGGEPLLLPIQCARIIELSRPFPNIAHRILLSNLALKDRKSLVAVLDSGVTETRVNVPHLKPEMYRDAVGRDRLQIVLDNCEVASSICAVRFQKVVDTQRETIAQLHAYIREASDLKFTSCVALLIDARSKNPFLAFNEVATALDMAFELVSYGQRHRRYRASRIDVVLSRCSQWDGATDVEEETDVYVVPPGIRLVSFLTGRAYSHD